MSDAWEEIQAVKSKRKEIRERLQKRRKEREDLLGGTDSTSSSKAEICTKLTGTRLFHLRLTVYYFVDIRNEIISDSSL